MIADISRKRTGADRTAHAKKQADSHHDACINGRPLPKINVKAKEILYQRNPDLYHQYSPHQRKARNQTTSELPPDSVIADLAKSHDRIKETRARAHLDIIAMALQIANDSEISVTPQRIAVARIAYKIRQSLPLPLRDELPKVDPDNLIDLGLWQDDALTQLMEHHPVIKERPSFTHDNIPIPSTYPYGVNRQDDRLKRYVRENCQMPHCESTSGEKLYCCGIVVCDPCMRGWCRVVLYERKSLTVRDPSSKPSIPCFHCCKLVNASNIAVQERREWRAWAERVQRDPDFGRY